MSNPKRSDGFDEFEDWMRERISDCTRFIKMKVDRDHSTNLIMRTERDEARAILSAYRRWKRSRG